MNIQICLLNYKMTISFTRVIQEQHGEWRRHRWQKMNTRLLREETKKQVDAVKNLPEAVFSWDVFFGIHKSIMEIQVQQNYLINFLM